MSYLWKSEQVLQRNERVFARNGNSKRYYYQREIQHDTIQAGTFQENTSFYFVAKIFQESCKTPDSYLQGDTKFCSVLKITAVLKFRINKHTLSFIKIYCLLCYARKYMLIFDVIQFILQLNIELKFGPVLFHKFQLQCSV